MLPKTSTALQLIFLVVVAMFMVSSVEARYCCCLSRMTTPSGQLGYSSYCDNGKSSTACRNAGLTWHSGFAGIGNGCDVGDWDTTDTAAKRKIGQFETGCGGRFTYKCY